MNILHYIRNLFTSLFHRSQNNDEKEQDGANTDTSSDYSFSFDDDEASDWEDVDKGMGLAFDNRGNRRFLNVNHALQYEYVRNRLADATVASVYPSVSYKYAQNCYVFYDMEHVLCVICKLPIFNRATVVHRRFCKMSEFGNIACASDYNDINNVLTRFYNAFLNRVPLDKCFVHAPGMNIMQNRLESLKSVSKAFTLPDHETLARAGFYYVGPCDFLQCFKCGGGLYNWRSNDDPIEDHMSYFPECTHNLNFVENDYETLSSKRYPVLRMPSLKKECKPLLCALPIVKTILLTKPSPIPDRIILNVIYNFIISNGTIFQTPKDCLDKCYF